MKNLKELTNGQLEDLLHHLVEAERILNIYELSLTDMDPEKDSALIHLNCMKICTFDEICRQKRNLCRHENARKRIREHLMASAEMSEIEANGLIDDVIGQINCAIDMYEIEEIWECEFGIELDDLNDLMGW